MTYLGTVFAFSWCCTRSEIFKLMHHHFLCVVDFKKLGVLT